jgi:hypothetical protein
VEEPGARQVAFAAERLAHALARIVVAGDDEERHYKRRQQHPKMLVFGGRAVLNEIPGDDGHIGLRRQSVELNDRARQAGSRVEAAPIGSGAWRGGLLWRVEQLPRRQDMRIGNLARRSTGRALPTRGAGDRLAALGRAAGLFTSPESAFAPGKAIRDGIPIIFPVVRPESARAQPQHGLARTATWHLGGIETAESKSLAITLSLTVGDVGSTIWPEPFRAVYTVIFAQTLSLRLTVQTARDIRSSSRRRCTPTSRSP